eukprot:612770-Amphidinium_carterae.1
MSGQTLSCVGNFKLKFQLWCQRQKRGSLARRSGIKPELGSDLIARLQRRGRMVVRAAVVRESVQLQLGFVAGLKYLARACCIAAIAFSDSTELRRMSSPPRWLGAPGCIVLLFQTS